MPGTPKREVSVYVQRTGPRFDEILDPGRIKALEERIARDPNRPFLTIGEYQFSIADLKAVEADAMNQLFGSVEDTFKTLGRSYGSKVPKP